MTSGRPTLLPEKWRMPLRIAAVVVAYVLYRLPGDDQRPAGIAIGIGALLFAFVMIDRWSLRRSERSGLLQVGTTILALGLIGVGLLLALR